MKKTIHFLQIIPLLFAAVTLKAQATIYVATGANGSGTSWANATGNLKTALENAAAGTQIWVKEGTYRPTSCTNCSFNERNQRFQIPSGVKLYGGFGGFETMLSQRDWMAHPTILSGDIDQSGTLANNSFTIIYTYHVNAQTLVDGFSISGGNADQSAAGLGTPQTSGAGWFNVGSTTGSASHPSVANCRFEDNYAWGYGAGMFNDGSFGGACNPVLTNCTFINNVSGAGGGAIYNSGSFDGLCSPTLTDCVFENNECESSDGGAIFNIGSESGVCNPSMTNCIFLGNTASHDGGAIYSFGKGGNSSPLAQNCIFENNTAGTGGAVYNDGTFNGYCEAEYLDCVFLDNHSTEGDGGAMYNSGYLGTCNPVLKNCLFEKNESAFGGGALFNNGSEGTCNPVITNSRFVENIADTYGGAMYNQGKTGNASPEITNCIFQNNTALSAGAIYNLGSNNGNANAFITNCTFFGNHANVGGAVYCNAGEGGTGVASPTVRNSIFWQNTASDEGDIFRIIWGTPNISHCLVDKANCAALYNGNGGSVNCGVGMKFNQNPMFVSPATGNFHIQEDTSPTVDDGSNEAIAQTDVLTDLDGLPRIFNGTVDMGVYEFASAIGEAPAITQNPADLEICQDETAIFSVSATGSQPLSFQWLKNGVAISGADQSTFSIQNAGLGDAGNYSCSVTNSTGETVVSAAATLEVNAPAQVSISISASQTEVCAGEQVTFSAAPTNGGSAPVFQWFINGNAFGGNVSTFNISSQNDGDTFTCQLSSSQSCVANASAVSNTISINVESVLVASLSIASDTETGCEGHTITFTAFPVNGGNFPVYQWFVNGNPVGGNSPTFSSATLENGDAVACTMISSKNCVLVNTVHSTSLNVNIIPNQTTTISITPSVDSTFCMGTEVTFSATVENAGTMPVYDWLLNGAHLNNNAPILTADYLKDGDVLACYLTSSLLCLLENPVVSNAVTVSVDSCASAADVPMADESNFLLQPNPSSGKIFIQIQAPESTFALRLSNTHGQVFLNASFENRPNVPYFSELDLTDLPKGIYFLHIITNRTIGLKRLVLQ